MDLSLGQKSQDGKRYWRFFHRFLPWFQVCMLKSLSARTTDASKRGGCPQLYSNVCLWCVPHMAHWETPLSVTSTVGSGVKYPQSEPFRPWPISEVTCSCAAYLIMRISFLLLPGIGRSQSERGSCPFQASLSARPYSVARLRKSTRFWRSCSTKSQGVQAALCSVRVMLAWHPHVVARR